VSEAASELRSEFDVEMAPALGEGKTKAQLRSEAQDDLVRPRPWCVCVCMCVRACLHAF
jgi:hypothetical protein